MRGGRRIIAGMSGAQAAAGDLLNARSPSEIAEAVADPAEAAAATDVFSAFETFYKARRTYQQGHPALDRFYVALGERVGATLARYEQIEVGVTALGLQLGGHAVFEADRAEANMWFPLYRDGIRALTFAQGLERAEIDALCGALALLASQGPEDGDDGEDDAVTMLWDLALEHISYAAIESFSDGVAMDPETQARAERVRQIITVNMMKELVLTPGHDSHTGRDIVAARQLRSVAVNEIDLRWLERDNLAGLDALPDRVRSSRGQLYTVDAVDREALATALEAPAGIEERALEAIMQSLADAVDPAMLHARIAHAFAAVVAAGDFATAVRLRRQVLAASPDKSVDAAMASALAPLRTALIQRADAEPLALVEIMPASTVAALVATIDRIDTRARRRPLCDVLAKHGALALDAAVAAMPAAGEPFALDLLYLIRRVGGPAAASAMDRALQHPVPAVRAAALRGYDGPALASRLRAALRDLDPSVRAVALEVIVGRRLADARRWFEDVIAGDDYAARDADEKRALLVAYATVGGADVAPALRARLAQRNLLGRAAIDEDRAAAAAALAHLRDEDSRDALGKLAAAKLTRKLVTDAAAAALADLDRPPPPPPRMPRATESQEPVVTFKRKTDG